MGSKSPEGHYQTPDGMKPLPFLACRWQCDPASSSNELKPAYTSPKVTRGGSSSADLDRGIVGDDDDDHDNEAASPGMMTAVDAGTYFSCHTTKFYIVTVKSNFAVRQKEKEKEV